MNRDAAVITAGSVEDAFGRHMRQQLGWLGFATLPPRAAELLQWWSGDALRPAAGLAPVHTAGCANTNVPAIHPAESGCVAKIRSKSPINPVLST